MNSPRSVLLATMPPTLAAARNTACGRLSANHLNTAAWSRRSTSLRRIVSSSTSSCASRRTSAPPTIPRCPATKTVLPFSSNGVFAMGHLPLGNRPVARHHLLDELGEGRFRLPAELLLGLAGIADQKTDPGGREGDGNEAPHGLAAPLDAAADFRKRDLDEFAHRAGFARRPREIVGRARLQDLVHALDVI